MKRETLADARAPTVEALAPTARFSLRARSAHVVPLGEALGVALPTRIGGRASAGAREVLCLGPDEWLILAPEAEAKEIAACLASLYDTAPYALAEISDRELSYRVSGPGAIQVIAMGCPRDLRAIAPGQATRTVFDDAAVILWRDGPENFRLDIWRSFAPHVLALLKTGVSELQTGV